MEKRIIIAVVISLVLLFVYPYFLKWVAPPAQKAVEGARESTSVAAVNADGAKKAEAKAAAAPAAPSVAEEFVTVETPLYRAVFTTLGGGIKSWELKNYRTALTENSPPANLATTVARYGSLKTRLVSGGMAENIDFSPSATRVMVGDGGIGELVFTGRTRAGVNVEKRYTFTASTYVVETGLKITGAASGEFDGMVDTVLYAGTAGVDDTGYHTGPLILAQDKLRRQDDDERQIAGSGTVKWLGLEDKYFLAVVIPPPGSEVSWLSEVASLTSSTSYLQMPLKLAPGQTAELSYKSFVGPKEYDLLKKHGIWLEDSIEFGYFSFMAKPALVALNFFERFFGNYGLAIIVLTVIVKVAFYPLTKKSLTSMKEMQKLQPQLVAIKEKYKNEKDKLNKEIMELYKRQKVNPLGGCLPIVLQIPVFIALYECLYVAIELRHAPLVWWIQDLSAKDPYYITPVLMGATMFLQQKMTPTAADPMQAKIMMFMPIVFTFLFLTFPSGLVLYWLINNVLSIGQQYLIYRAPSKAAA